PADLDKMRAACRDAARILDFITPYVKPGVTTGELDRLCLEYLTDELKVQSATIGYAPPGYPPFPGAICTSVNHVVCHGIPGDKALKDGDALNIDVTVIKDGYHGDTSRMFSVGKTPEWVDKLSRITQECMYKGIEAVRPGAHLGDIGEVIQKHAEKHGYSVVRDYCAH